MNVHAPDPGATLALFLLEHAKQAKEAALHEQDALYEDLAEAQAHELEAMENARDMRLGAGLASGVATAAAGGLLVGAASVSSCESLAKPGVARVASGAPADTGLRMRLAEGGAKLIDGGGVLGKSIFEYGAASSDEDAKRAQIAAEASKRAAGEAGEVAQDQGELGARARQYYQDHLEARASAAQAAIRG